MAEALSRLIPNADCRLILVRARILLVLRMNVASRKLQPGAEIIGVAPRSNHAERRLAHPR